jgi:type IX secretion system substrate protein
MGSCFSNFHGGVVMKRGANPSFLFAFLFCIASANISYPQDTSTMKYLPLSVGNVWLYYGLYNYPFGQGTYYDKYRITGTVQSGGHTYFTFNHQRVQLTGAISGREIRLFWRGLPIRVDSTTINVYKDTVCNASLLLVDSLKARKNDSSNTCEPFSFNFREICSDTSFYNICGANRKSKTFYLQNGIEGGDRPQYVKDIGVVSYLWFQHQENATYTLRGCVINGTLCGDTSLTGITPISSEVPESFQLYQNYPNPFNPVTKIRFDIPSGFEHRTLNIELIIYDILGKEIATLVNELLHPGIYEVEFDGSNFPSGVYFYKLETEDFYQSRRMVLIK